MNTENESVFDPPEESGVQEPQEQQFQQSEQSTPETQGEQTSETSSQHPQQGGQSAPDNNAAIAQAIQQGFATLQQNQPQQQQPQLTQEQLEERLKVYKFNDDFSEALRTELMADEPDKAAITALFNSAHQRQMEQAQTYAQLAVQAMQKQIMEQMSPALQYAQKAEQQAKQERFFKSYPSLKNFEKLMPLVAQQVHSQGMQFQTEEQAFQAIATAAEAHIKNLNPNFTLGGKQQQANKQGATTPNTLSFGGQGGSGGGQTAKKGGDSGIWD